MLKQPPELQQSEADVPVSFRVGRMSVEQDVDMTPMVDVTFLLLIFFMVTAAFSLQKSIEVPPPDQQQSAAQSRTIEEIEEDDDYVIVRIDGNDRIWVTTFGEEAMAPSEQELLERLREARRGPAGSDSPGASQLLVLADGDCKHQTVVMALDAGNAVGMQNVRLATASEMDFY